MFADTSRSAGIESSEVVSTTVRNCPGVVPDNMIFSRFLSRVMGSSVLRLILRFFKDPLIGTW